jgi:hypothetical protein
MGSDPNAHLEGEPSRFAFDRALRALHALEREEGDDAARGAVARAADALAGWPASARVAPRWLLEAWTAGARPRCGELVRALEVGPSEGTRRAVHATQVLQRAPLSRLRAIRLTAADSDGLHELADALAEAPAGALRALELRACQVTSGAHARLSAARGLGELTTLALPRTVASPEHVTGWASSPGWAGLESLDLSDNALGLTGATRLTSAPNAGLRHLAVAGCGLDSGALRAILSSRAFPGLGSLEVGRNPWTVGCWDALREARLEGLEVLNLDGAHVGVEIHDARAMPWSSPVRAVSLRRARLDGSHAEPLARVLPREPRELDLSGNHLQARAARSLLDGVGPGALEALSLSLNPIRGGDVGEVLGALAGAPLARLGISASAHDRTLRDEVSARAVLDALEALPSFGALRALDVSGRLSAPEEAAWLAMALPEGLEELAVRDCRVDDAAFAALARRCPGLRVLDVSENAALSLDAIVQALHEGAWPGLEELRASLIGARASDPRLQRALQGLCERRGVALDRGDVPEAPPLTTARWGWVMRTRRPVPVWGWRLTRDGWWYTRA